MRRAWWICWVVACGGTPTATLYPVGGSVFALQPPPANAPPRIPIEAGASPDAKMAALISFLRAQSAADDVPGVAVAVVLDGQLRYEAGIGVRRAGSSDPVTAHTLFRAASSTKLVTAIALANLAQRGLIDLDRPAIELVPELTRGAGHDPSQITLRHALAHTAALPDDGPLSCALPQTARLHDYFIAHAHDPLWAPAGTTWNYANTNFMLAGAALENVTGLRFDDYVRDTVLRPAGMTSATFDLAAARRGELAAGHDHRGRVLAGADRNDCLWLHPAGGLIASAHDFARLLEILVAGGGPGVSPAALAAIETRQIATQDRRDRDYGLGLFAWQHHGLRVFAHPGGLPGYSAMIAFIPERRFAIALLANSGADTPRWASAAIDLFLDLSPEPPPQRVPEVTPYVGVYEDATGQLGRFAVRADGTRLVMQLLGGQRAAIPGQLTGSFWCDADGAVTSFVTRIGIARKLRSPPPAAGKAATGP